MWNAGTGPARMIEIITPAGFEKYFIELAEATAAAGRRPDPSVTAPIAERTLIRFRRGARYRRPPRSATVRVT